jgi:tRNA A37 methylthiotransferase MiaB
MATARESSSYAGKGKCLYIVTYGCQINEADSEVMGRLLEREDYKKRIIGRHYRKRSE